MNLVAALGNSPDGVKDKAPLYKTDCIKGTSRAIWAQTVSVFVPGFV